VVTELLVLIEGTLYISCELAMEVRLRCCLAGIDIYFLE
jgi:hypothetical protein